MCALAEEKERVPFILLTTGKRRSRVEIEKSFMEKKRRNGEKKRKDGVGSDCYVKRGGSGYE